MIGVRALGSGGVRLIEPQAFEDERGYFLEAWNGRALANAGVHAAFVQDNLVHSAHGVIRGLHYRRPHGEGKLVRCVAGEIFDVAVDLRRTEPTFATWVGAVISEANHLALWIPPGFAHGYCVLSESATVYYKCTEFYDRDGERLLIWNDPAVGIVWPLERLREQIVNARDAAAPRLADAEGYE